ncbi:MAG: glycoside hydrolase family 3 C-terminal domain-containing protein [Lachnospiraceae bacterium]|nr:glycoside hydrolase family 3 C-terminal domain-containing protein [Lachnospiraceae bacterium]
MEKYQDRTLSPGERAEDLLGKMSLEEKMAQTNCVLVPIGREEQVSAYCKNGIGEISTLEVRALKTTQEAVAFQRRIQSMILENSPHHIPAIFHMEGLCGAFIQDATSFPSGIGRGSSWDPELEKKIGRIVARQEGAVGFTHTLAPVLDISRDSRMGRQGETYGEDPTLAAALGTAYTKGIQDEEVGGRHQEAVAKHFMGFHNSEAGIHGAASDTPPRLLKEVYGKPFQAAIREASLRGVMPCYCTLDGEPASSSRRLLTEMLRDEMGFNGLAVSDYSAIENIHNVQKAYESVTEAGYHAMAAGMDIEMPVKAGFNEELTEWFRTGKVGTAVLDEAVRRILEAKFRMGLFENPFPLEGEAFEQTFFQKEDNEISLQSARESLVLLKNNEWQECSFPIIYCMEKEQSEDSEETAEVKKSASVLPLGKGLKKIAVVGCHAKNARSFFGGYTHISMVEATHAVTNSIAGIGGAGTNQEKTVPLVPGTQIQSDETEEFDEILRQIKPGCKSLLEEVRSRLPDTEVIYAYGYPIAGDDTSGYEEALTAVAEADLCILTLGGKHGSCSVASMGEGVDGTDINLPECQELFIRKAARLGKPLVGIHFNGRPISSDAADECLNAIIEAWNPSEMGAQAIVDVLTGEYNPSGKLPVSVARSAGQIPIYYNHPNGSSWHQGASIGFANYVDMPHTPRYFFGYGLSYTSFAYDDFCCDKQMVAPDELFHVSLSVENTGKTAGTEVVQLYLKDTYASMVRPVMELAGFARVELMPGEKKTVEFDLTPSQMAFLDWGMNWKIEKGKLEILIGSASNDIRLTGEVEVTGDLYIKGKDRRFYAGTSVYESAVR